MNSGDDSKPCSGKCTAFKLARQTNGIFSLNMLFSAFVPPDRFISKALPPAVSVRTFPPILQDAVRGPLPALPSSPASPDAGSCFCSPTEAPSRPSFETVSLSSLYFIYLLVLSFLLKYTLPEGRVYIWLTFGASKQMAQGLAM